MFREALLTRDQGCATLLTGCFMIRRCTPLKSPLRRLCLPLFLSCWLALAASAQSTRGEMINAQDSLNDRIATMRAHRTAQGTGVIIVSVFGERNGSRLDRQATLKLVDRSTQNSSWATTDGTAQGFFTDIPFGGYEVEISAVGYLSIRKEVEVVPTLVQVEVDVILQRDPTAVNLGVADTMLSPKARKGARRAVSALKSGNLKEAQKQLDEAYRSAPSSPDLNFLLGYLYFQKKDFEQAGTYLGTATTLSPHNAQALTLLGMTGLERGDYPAARSALEQAVLADEGNWVPHSLLADTYLHEKDYAKARDEAQIAIVQGRGVSTTAQLILGEALVSLGRNQEGIEALQLFLRESPQVPIAAQVRDFIVETQQRVSAASAPGGVHSTASLNVVNSFSAKAWQPAGTDDVKLPIALDVACPAERVTDESGRRVQELVEDVTRFGAVEDLVHQSLNEYGNPVRTENRKYNYVASVSEPQPGFLAVDEYRADKVSLENYPGNIASTGFAALALVFHPHMRDNFEMVCEGLGDLHGQATWLVHFRQRDDRPNRMHSYKVGNEYHPVKLKGRAWITADKFQIVRIEAEMVSPMPEIQLLSEHQIVEYGPIPFAKKNTSIWLPKSAEIYFDFRKHRYYRRHSFDHYMLYSVDVNEKRKEPVAPPAGPEASIPESRGAQPVAATPNR
jgi:tetratricopeptide (TPR) repeat protein